MAITNTDITNRALQLIGTRTTVTSLAESSNEASQANLVFTAVRDWCLGVGNWNFARKTVIATPSKTVSPVVPWSNASPSPPWKFEYVLPTDTIKVQYITVSTLNTGADGYLGEPKRFQVAVDTIAAVERQVILCNEPSTIVIVYTAQITDPTEWPWMFERFMVATLAWTLSMALTGDRELTKELNATMSNYLNIAVQANTAEGLLFNDTAPEWIAALGINYPLRRTINKPNRQSKGQPNGDER